MSPILRPTLLAAFLTLTIPASAQSPAFSATPAPYTPTLTFDVASIRQSPDADSYMIRLRFQNKSTDLEIQNFDIANIITTAFGIRRDQIVDLPDWGPHAYFNIQAKADQDGANIYAKLSRQQKYLERQHMLQTLLSDRFNLKTHWENRTTSVYSLVVAKQGPKLSPSGSLAHTPEEARNWGTRPLPPLYQRNDGTGYDLVAHDCAISNLTEMLSGLFGKPVLDQTNLTAKYDFVLPYQGTLIADRAPDDLDPVPPLEQALQVQLGLKLVPGKGTDRFLVIDHIEKPTPN